jgi:hypothetical protein
MAVGWEQPFRPPLIFSRARLHGAVFRTPSSGTMFVITEKILFRSRTLSVLISSYAENCCLAIPQTSVDGFIRREALALQIYSSMEGLIVNLTTTAQFNTGRAIVVALALTFSLTQAGAKESGCLGGGFSIVGANVQNGSIAAVSLGSSFSVRGKYVEFDVDSATFGIRDYALTGAPDPSSLTEGNRIVLYSSKTPDHRGLQLTSDVSVEIKDASIVLQRSGAGLWMKIQAADCPTGGIFQMEPARADGGVTDVIHTLGSLVFYFNNPNFGPPPPPLPLCPAGGPFTPSCTPVPITPRINFASDISSKLVGRDSPQVATKLSQTGGVSVWRISSGGRMGGVLGGDAVEVAPPATVCVSNCQAQNQVKGKYPVLGFPYPVPIANRITPR